MNRRALIAVTLCREDTLLDSHYVDEDEEL